MLTYLCELQLIWKDFSWNTCCCLKISHWITFLFRMESLICFGLFTPSFALKIPMKLCWYWRCFSMSIWQVMWVIYSYLLWAQLWLMLYIFTWESGDIRCSLSVPEGIGSLFWNNSEWNSDKTLLQCDNSLGHMFTGTNPLGFSASLGLTSEHSAPLFIPWAPQKESASMGHWVSLACPPKGSCTPTSQSAVTFSQCCKIGFIRQLEHSIE